MGRVLPQLLGLGAHGRIDDAAAELAHHQAGDEGLQAAVADAHDGGAHIGQGGVAIAVESGRIGQRHRARGQLRLAQHQLDRLFDMAVRVIQRQLKAQCRIHASGEGNVPPRGLGCYISEGFESIHAKIIPLPAPSQHNFVVCLRTVTTMRHRAVTGERKRRAMVARGACENLSLTSLAESFLPRSRL